MRTLHLALAGALCLLTLGCATAERSFHELDALRQIEVDVDGTRQETLAGIALDDLRNPNRLGIREAAILTTAIRDRSLPLRLIVDLEARNPHQSSRTARILGIDWRLLLEDQEAVTGALGAQPAIDPGGSILIPVSLDLDLVEIFGNDLQELLRAALGVAGYGEGSDIDAVLMMTPTVETALGPVRYPEEIRVRLD